MQNYTANKRMITTLYISILEKRLRAYKDKQHDHTLRPYEMHKLTIIPYILGILLSTIVPYRQKNKQKPRQLQFRHSASLVDCNSVTPLELAFQEDWTGTFENKTEPICRIRNHMKTKRKTC